MVDLSKRPFYLNEEQIKWVEDTIASMTFDEKVGQLFINLTLRRDPATIDALCNKYHIGGVRWQGGKLEEVYEQNRMFQEKSKVPVLIAANCEAGGNGAVGEGTKLREAYGKAEIAERHRHRYEFNNLYREEMTKAGMVISGTSPDGRLVEAVELPDRKFFVAVQYHPEFKSRPNDAHPLFREFIRAALK